jgi:hypothetical protein
MSIEQRVYFICDRCGESVFYYLGENRALDSICLSKL